MSKEQEWCFTVPPREVRNDTLMLLTIGKMQVRGRWQGGLGEFFVAWAPLASVRKGPVQVANGPRR
jgi:hypothetical protein